MSTIANLRHDHRRLLSIAVSLSAPPTSNAADVDHLRYRIDNLCRQLAEHLLRETDYFNSVATNLAISARREEANAVKDLVTGFAAMWQQAGAIESDLHGYAQAVGNLRLRLDRLVRREEDCMFVMLGGRQTDHAIRRAGECRCPEIRSALERTVAALGALRAELIDDDTDIQQQIPICEISSCNSLIMVLPGLHWECSMSGWVRSIARHGRILGVFGQAQPKASIGSNMHPRPCSARGA